MTTFNYGDVVLVAFPFTNHQATKKRPAVVISRPEYQQNCPDVILMAITSQLQQPYAVGEVILEQWQEAGLAKPSVLKPLIATIEQQQIVKVIGKLSQNDQNSLEQVIKAIIEI